MDSSSNNPKQKLGLRKDSKRDELVISGADEEEQLEDEGTLLASNSRGSSLTLLEEYAQRKKENYTKTFFIALICAGVSLTFAYLIFLKL